LYFLVCVTIPTPDESASRKPGTIAGAVESTLFVKRKECQYRDQYIQYMITQTPATGLWVSKGQVLVRENGTLRVLPVLFLRDNFTNEHDAELYIVSAAEEMIDKLLQSTAGLQDSNYKNRSSDTNIPEQ
jgi:hypothetical protein